MWHIQKILISSQENQGYYNQHDQQPITCKHDGSRGHYNQSDK